MQGPTIGLLNVTSHASWSVHIKRSGIEDDACNSRYEFESFSDISWDRRRWCQRHLRQWQPSPQCGLPRGFDTMPASLRVRGLLIPSVGVASPWSYINGIGVLCGIIG